MERLVPINDKIRGCEINFPDTVFFYKGKPKIQVKTDKDGNLIAIRTYAKINLHQIKTSLSSLIFKRKAKLNGPAGINAQSKVWM